MKEERVMGACILDEPFHRVEHLLLCRPLLRPSSIRTRMSWKLNPYYSVEEMSGWYVCETKVWVHVDALMMKSHIFNASFLHPFSAFFCPTLIPIWVLVSKHIYVKTSSHSRKLLPFVHYTWISRNQGGGGRTFEVLLHLIEDFTAQRFERPVQMVQIMRIIKYWRGRLMTRGRGVSINYNQTV